MPTLTFDVLTSNETDDQDLVCAIHLPSLVMLRPVVFVLERLTHILHTYPHRKLLLKFYTAAAVWLKQPKSCLEEHPQIVIKIAVRPTYTRVHNIFLVLWGWQDV